MERAGVIRTLAEPNLTAISGESANFLAGGEFPIPAATPATRPTHSPRPISSRNSVSSLNFTPVVLSEGRISLKVMTEVSELSNEKALTLQSQAARPSPSPRSDAARRYHDRNSVRRLARDGRHDPGTDQAADQRIPGLMQLPDSRHAVQEPRLRQPPDRAHGARNALYRACRCAQGPVAARRWLCRCQRSCGGTAGPLQPHLWRGQTIQSTPIRKPPTTAITASFSTERARKETIDEFNSGSDREAARQPCRSPLGAARWRDDARRLRHYQCRTWWSAPSRSDYRQRHPIVIKEEPQHGRAVHRQQARHAHARATRRCPRLRARMAARSDRRRPDRLAGRHRQRSSAAAGAMHEVRAILASCRRAGERRRRASQSPARSAQAGHAAHQLSADHCRGGPLRTMAATIWAGLWARASGKSRILESRLRHAAQSRRHGGQPVRPGAAARRNSHLRRPPGHSSR